VRFVAGHSLGEYSALAAAGAFSLADTARLLRLRGQAMQKAVPVGQGAMTALLGVGIDVARKVAEAAAEGDVCQVANDNEPTQVVLSGHKSAIDRVPEAGKAFGVRRAIPLPVSAPFHCSLMQPAADAMAEALAKVTINKPAVPVVANVLATPISDPDEIRKRLVEQVTGTVRWRECVLYMAANGITDVYEIGAGKVLSGLAGRIDKSLKATPVGTPADIEAVAAGLV
jgi:[acyl-carrier-protein] S-malonyltransferase